MPAPAPSQAQAASSGPVIAMKPLRKPLLLLSLGLALLSGTAAAQDSAYVDSPAGRVADPARADGGSVPPADPQISRAGAGADAQQAALIQMQMQMAQQAMAQAREQDAQAAAQAQAGAAGVGQQPGGVPTPAQQIGSGLMQDAGGLIDAGIQRQTGGVVVMPYPQAFPAPGASDPMAPPAPNGW